MLTFEVVTNLALALSTAVEALLEKANSTASRQVFEQELGKNRLNKAKPASQHS